jgi:hypothetical protein
LIKIFFNWSVKFSIVFTLYSSRNEIKRESKRVSYLIDLYQIKSIPVSRYNAWSARNTCGNCSIINLIKKKHQFSFFLKKCLFTCRVVEQSNHNLLLLIVQPDVVKVINQKES